MLLFSLLIACLLPRPVAAAAGGPSPAEARLLELANAERTRAGVAPLRWHEPLAAVARAHAADMRSQGEIGHVSSDGSVLADRVARADVRSRRAAENTGRAWTLEQVHEGLIRSPGHRANILDSRLEVAGFGVVSGKDGTWVVQDFATLAPDWTDDQARAAVLRAVRARGWAEAEDPEISRALQPAADAMAAADSASVRGLAHPGCWLLGMAGPDPADLPSAREPSCEAARAGVAVTWARTPTRPLGAWFVAISVAP